MPATSAASSPGQWLREHIGEGGGLGAARVDHEQLDAARLGLAQRVHRVLHVKLKVDSETSGLAPITSSTSAWS